jgi:hypothetical protein
MESVISSLSASPLTSCVALDKSLTLSEHPFPHDKMELRMLYSITKRIIQGKCVERAECTVCIQEVLSEY